MGVFYELSRFVPIKYSLDNGMFNREIIEILMPFDYSKSKVDLVRIACIYDDFEIIAADLAEEVYLDPEISICENYTKM